MKTYVQIIPGALKGLRNSRAWTQAQLAEKTREYHGGVSARTILRIERAQVDSCETRTALSLSETLGVPLDALRYPIHPMIYDIGGEVLLDLSADDDEAGDESIREGMEQLLEMRRRRRLLLARKKAKNSSRGK